MNSIIVKTRSNTGSNKIQSLVHLETIYYVEVDGKDLSCVAETEEVALLLGIGYKIEGNNSRFAEYAAKMLKIDSLWTVQEKTK